MRVIFVRECLHFIMERLTPAQRLQIIELLFENQCSTRNVFRILRETYGSHNRPTERTIRVTISKFATTWRMFRKDLGVKTYKIQLV